MTIAHHLDDATLVALAAGTLNEAHAVIASAHIAMCPHCRATFKNAEAIGGSILAEQTVQPLSKDLKAATLAKLNAVKLVEKPAARQHNGSDLPDVLVRALGVR